MTDLSPTSRFQLLPSPVTHPGKCAVCGAVNRPVVDFGANVDFYGALYFCESCLAEAATLIGMIPAETLEGVRVEAGQSIREYLFQKQMRVVTDEFYNAAVNFIGAFHLSNAVDPIYSVPEDDESDGAEVPDDANGTPETVVSTDATDSEFVGEPGKAESEIDEQGFDFAFDEGPDSVPDDSGDGESRIVRAFSI